MWSTAGLDPSPASTDRARARVLGVIRALRTLDAPGIAQPLAAADPSRLEGFRRLLEMRESDPGAADRLADTLMLFDRGIQERLDHVATELPESRYGSVREWLERRSYRRVHSAALGAGAAVMWSFGRMPDALWLHANATGLLTMMACRHDAALRDSAFAAGLLHNIGRVALIGVESGGHPGVDAHPELAQEPAYAQAVGEAVMRELGLPAHLATVAQPCGARPQAVSRLARLSAAACSLAAQLGFVDETMSGDVALPDPVALDEVAAALSEAGGADWAWARVKAPLIGARAGFFAALDAA